MRKLFTPAVAVFLLAAEASAQVAAPPSVSGSLMQMFLGLLGILALLVGSLWLLKKLTVQRGAAAGLLRVVAVTPIGGRERVVIVEVGSTWLVLGVAPGRVSALAEIPRQALPEMSPGAGTAALPAWLQHLMRKPRA
ncbi:MAG: flagellar biosynthetic protein FliO [Sulfuritalea sp.]|nr:flagellar biosynthetic protein FliO [Sulfuritalea sp.]